MPTNVEGNAIFMFNLGERVHIAVSGEAGEIIGRAQYFMGEDAYLLRYKAADGRAVEQWWNEQAIEARFPTDNE
jgi:hypothetical protein